MNKKRTNYTVAIINFIAIVSLFVLYFSKDFLNYNIATGPSGVKSLYNSSIIDILMSNIKLIEVLLYSVPSIFNIICAIQNIKNRKLSILQFIFGVYEAFWAIATVINPTREMIVNIIINVITIIPLIIQFIFIHFQDKNMQESKLRKVANIVLYNIIFPLIVIGIFILIIVSLIITKTNYDTKNSQVVEILNNIGNLSGITNEEIYMPVENNSKYGFINDKGEEKIPCIYDGVSNFYSTEINNQKCYFAFARENNNYYIISKNDAKVDVSDNKYLQEIINYAENEMIDYLDNSNFDTLIYSFVLQAFMTDKVEMNAQTQNITF